MTETLFSLGREAAKALENYHFVRVISHNDADGLSAAGIMSTALLRANIVFHTSIVSSLDKGVIDMVNAQVYGKGGAVVFCDMGSGQPELLDMVKDDVVIIDHHQVVGDHSDRVHVNPHMLGIDGSSLLSASGMAYYVARGMGDNTDLAGLALTGAVGDKQSMDGPNSEIMEEALEAGVISVKTGLKVPDGPVEDVLLTLTEPYLDTVGDKAATEAFLSELGVSGTIQDMGIEDLGRLASAMALKIAGRADPTVVRSMVVMCWHWKKK